jgi:hypothetical protein
VQTPNRARSELEMQKECSIKLAEATRKHADRRVWKQRETNQERLHEPPAGGPDQGRRIEDKYLA